MFEIYNKYLGREFSDDYWSDEGIGHAASLLGKFSYVDWDLLTAAHKGKSNLWLVRCAETLSDNVSARAFDLLILMLDTDDADVRIAALDSINALALAGFDITPYSQKLNSQLSVAGDNAGNVTKMMLSSLQKKLQ